jgi:hypothetical protein
MPYDLLIIVLWFSGHYPSSLFSFCKDWYLLYSRQVKLYTMKPSLIDHNSKWGLHIHPTFIHKNSMKFHGKHFCFVTRNRGKFHSEDKKFQLFFSLFHRRYFKLYWTMSVSFFQVSMVLGDRPTYFYTSINKFMLLELKCEGTTCSDRWRPNCLILLDQRCVSASIDSLYCQWQQFDKGKTVHVKS